MHVWSLHSLGVPPDSQSISLIPGQELEPAMASLGLLRNCAKLVRKLRSGHLPIPYQGLKTSAVLQRTKISQRIPRASSSWRVVG